MEPAFVRLTLIPISPSEAASFVWMCAEPLQIVEQGRPVIFLAALLMFIFVRRLLERTFLSQGKLVPQILNVHPQRVLKGLAERFVCEMPIALGILCAGPRF